MEALQDDRELPTSSSWRRSPQSISSGGVAAKNSSATCLHLLCVGLTSASARHPYGAHDLLPPSDNAWSNFPSPLVGEGLSLLGLRLGDEYPSYAGLASLPSLSGARLRGAPRGFLFPAVARALLTRKGLGGVRDPPKVLVPAALELLEHVHDVAPLVIHVILGIPACDGKRDQTVDATQERCSSTWSAS